MMKYLLFISLLLHTNLGLAETISGEIHSVDLGMKPHEEHLVKLMNGRVIYLPYSQKSLAETLKSKKGDKIEATMDDKQNTYSLKSLPHTNEVAEIEDFNSFVEFQPTIIPDLNDAKKIFNRLNPKYRRDSQCFNRAHVWAYEEFKNFGIKTTKTFAFFTASYLRDYRFSWWFHVAPTVHVNEGGQIVERVLDHRFSFGPLTIKEWTDLFVYTGRLCPLITKFSEYDVNPQTENCYLMKGSMFFWQPTDFINQEKTGFEKTDFRQAEVNTSYKEAF